ncbi:hypothetical protein E3Q10_03197 [Wallemia mellicola]|uniref:NADH dehydrogenase [ubiquinone] iron-sulfur protein 5 n=1 Tax=Wallemia mellicola TaxID=1708541 RepID=A0A4T0QTQ1_9BASI|nr:hypothetical protein E3Q10_03197 [Wallemia mellicola]
MASGFGYTGGRTRCFAYWQDFQKCYAQADAVEDCIAQKEDYMECLHHGKEIARQKEIKLNLLKQQQKSIAEAQKNGQKVGVGLIDGQASN